MPYMPIFGVVSQASGPTISWDIDTTYSSFQSSWEASYFYFAMIEGNYPSEELTYFEYVSYLEIDGIMIIENHNYIWDWSIVYWGGSQQQLNIYDGEDGGMFVWDDGSIDIAENWTFSGLSSMPIKIKYV